MSIINLFTSGTVAKKNSQAVLLSISVMQLYCIFTWSLQELFENKIIFVVLIIQYNQMEIDVKMLCDK